MLTPAVTVTLRPSHAPSPMSTGFTLVMPCRITGSAGSAQAWSWSPMCTPRANSTSRPMMTDCAAMIVASPENEQPSPIAMVPPIAFSQQPGPNHTPAPTVMPRSPSVQNGGVATECGPHAAKLRRISAVNRRARTRTASL
jgi:hypothetical protein